MTVRELPVLDQPEVVACCPPLTSAVLTASDAEVLARQFAALADPVRLRLVSLLADAEGGAGGACDLVEAGGRGEAAGLPHTAGRAAGRAGGGPPPWGGRAAGASRRSPTT